MDAEWATAAGWAKRTINANLKELVPGRRSPLRYVAFNPAAIDEHNILIRVAPAKGAVNMDREWSPKLEYVVHLRDGKLMATFLGNDPRGIWLNRHTLLAVYNRPHTRTRLASRSGV